MLSTQKIQKELEAKIYIHKLTKNSHRVILDCIFDTIFVLNDLGWYLGYTLNNSFIFIRN